MIFLKRIILALAFSVPLIFSSITIAHAADSNWHAETKSYRVYLGVIPASMIKKDLTLIDKDKSLHGGIDNITSSSQHVMVSVFSKKGNKRIINATVIAKIKSKKLIGGNEITKPLEKMDTSGAVTYGNYFSLLKKGNYVIDVEIYQSDKNGYEKAKFIFKKE